MITRRHQLHPSIRLMSSEDANMVAATSCVTRLSDRLFLAHFRLNFPQTTTWYLLHLLSAISQHLTTMLLKKRSSKEFPLQSARKVPATEINDAGYTAGCTSPQISMASLTQPLFSRAHPRWNYICRRQIHLEALGWLLQIMSTSVCKKGTCN